MRRWVIVGSVLVVLLGAVGVFLLRSEPITYGSSNGPGDRLK